jgi:putative endopeptidase
MYNIPMNTPRPQDDFFTFVNGKWIEENPIPATEARWGSFDALHLEVDEQVKNIFIKLQNTDDASLDANGKKVKDFYMTGMDTEKLDILKDKPLEEFFKMVDGAADVRELSKVIGELHRRGMDIFWGAGPEQDIKNSDIVAFYIGQAGLSLPEKDYYVNQDEKSQVIRKKYLDYADDMVAFSSLATARKVGSKMVMDIETRLANASMTPVELRDIEKQYNKMSPVELAAISPNIDWEKYFEGLVSPIPEYIIVMQPEFIKEVSAIFGEIPLEDLKTYMHWHILSGAASFLNDAFNQKTFDFYGRTFQGATEMKPRWRRVLSVVNNMLDEAVGQLYVKEHFSESAKEKMKVLVEHLTVAYKARIEKLDWMGTETKEKALAKLAAVTKKLGYPDKWKDFSALEIGTDSYVQNYVRAYIFEFDREMKKIGGPVDRSRWYMSPQTVNACYSPTMNEVLFPAAFLQPPFFYPDADDALNFGAIGMTIGHELTHGFDDQGAIFDARGNMQNWWTKDDKERFEKQTAHLVEQFDIYEPLPGLHMNGKLTLGENIADLGGLLIAYDGLMLALGGKEAAAKLIPIDGHTPVQRFFIGYAISERTHSREESIRARTQTDPHSQGIYRVNGPLSNMPQFYDAFDVKPGDKLYREESDRVQIW